MHLRTWGHGLAGLELVPLADGFAAAAAAGDAQRLELAAYMCPAAAWNHNLT
jgi:hypothetical protein